MKKLGRNVSVVVSEIASLRIDDPPRDHGGHLSLVVSMKNGVQHVIRHDTIENVCVFTLKSEIEKELAA